MPSIMRDLGQHYEDVEITVSNVFGSPDGTYIGLEWTYASTRKSDGQRSVTPDAIIVEMHDGLIRSWREYFDLSTSVEFGMPPAAESERLDAAHDG
jgi:ketosteroid isomerase-like protein